MEIFQLHRSRRQIYLYGSGSGLSGRICLESFVRIILFQSISSSIRFEFIFSRLQWRTNRQCNLCTRNEQVQFNKILFKNIFFWVCPICTCICIFLIFSTMNVPKLGAKIDPGMALTPFPSIILDQTIFEPTAFWY